MAARIKISDAFNDKFDFAKEYASSCGYIFIDELKPTDFIAMRASFGLSSIDISEIKNHLEQKMKKITFDTTSINMPQRNNYSEIFTNGNSPNCAVNKIESVVLQDKCKEQQSAEIMTKEDNAIPVNDITINDLKQRVDYKSLSLDDDIETLGFSVRAINALREAKFNTIKQITTLTEEQLYEIKNLGKKTVNEILAVISELKDMELTEQHISFVINKNQLRLRRDIKNDIENIIFNKTSDNNYAEISLSDWERELINRIVNSTEILGSVFVQSIYTRPEYAKILMTEFDNFIKKTDRANIIIDKFNRIPRSRLRNKLDGYLKAFKMNDLDSMFTLFTDSQVIQIVKNSKDDSTFAVEDLIGLIRKSNLNDGAVKLYNILLNRLNFNMHAELQLILDDYKIKDPRGYNVLVRRLHGETLESIAKDMGLTRERIRQMEAKFNKLTVKVLFTGKDPLMLISADCNNDRIITHEEIVRYFNNEFVANVFINAVTMKNVKSDYFLYDKEIKAFKYIENDGGQIDLRETFSDLPEMIFEEELTDILNQIAYNKNLSIEEVQIRFAKAKFKKKGKVYYRGLLTNKMVYGYVLKHFYPSGIKLYNSKDTQYLRDKIVAIFDDIDLPDGNRAIDAAVSKIAILYDRGMYIHPSYVQIQDSMVDEIDAYLQSMDRVAISFSELFKRFKTELQITSNVNNRYFLQGVIKDRLSSRYYITRDYISREQQFSISEDIELFIKKTGRVHKSQILENFAGITEIVMAMKLAENKNIICLDNGEYIHSNLLNIEEDDYKIETYISSMITEYPVSSRKLLEEMWLHYPDFLIRNNINTHSELFGALRFLFDEKFKFSRPFIAKIDTGEISNLRVLRQYLKEYDNLSIEDLIYICNKNHILIASLHSTIRNLNSDFLRINTYNLARFNDEIFDDEIIRDVYLSIKDSMSNKGYAVGHKLNDFMMYPEIGFTWNAFLLRSIVEKYLNEQIEMIEMPTTDTYVMGTIYVSSDCESETYVELLKSILKKEHSREPFHSAREVIDWLKQEGLFLGDPPKCLTDGQIISTNKKSLHFNLILQ